MKLMLALCAFVVISVSPVFGGEKPVIPAAVAHHEITSQDSGKWKREPFVMTNKMNKSAIKNTLSPITTKNARVEDINLQGILSSENRYHALINGHVYKVGDIFDEFTISDISRYRVIVEKNKEKYVYDIHKGKINRGEK